MIASAEIRIRPTHADHPRHRPRNMVTRTFWVGGEKIGARGNLYTFFSRPRAGELAREEFERGEFERGDLAVESTCNFL